VYFVLNIKMALSSMAHAPMHNFKISKRSSTIFSVDDRRNETAQYVAEMLLQLRQLARQNEFETLQGLLEISYYEAFAEAHKSSVPEGEIEHLEWLGADFRKSKLA
jgi:hypothetical protein